MRFEGKAGIVTGGSSGIGKAIAHRLASEGASLCLVAAPQDDAQLAAVVAELGATGANAVGIAADVGEAATAERAVEKTLERYGRLDVLANNAGIAYFEELIGTPVEHLDHTLHVNVRGMFLMALAASRVMAERGGGAIACTASTASFAGEELQVTYNISKGAVAELVRSMAVDLAPHGVRVNAVAPGWVLTPPTEEIVADPAQWSKHRSRIPLDRPAEPAEIAAVVAFLLSDDATYMTGSIVIADGGLTAGFRYSDWEAVPQAREPRGRRNP
jgi:NAD(P)-dependent dehydrogenase (short-subunit alcohol dehydrogenase family)